MGLPTKMRASIIIRHRATGAIVQLIDAVSVDEPTVDRVVLELEESYGPHYEVDTSQVLLARQSRAA